MTLNTDLKYSDILLRHLAGETNPEENFVIKEWLNESQENLNYYLQLERLWNDTENRLSLDEKYSTIDIWNKVRNTFDAKYRKKQRIIGFKWITIAASIMLFIFAGFLAWHLISNSEMKIVTALEIQKVVLPDNSIIWLNRNTTLSYKTNFRKERKIILSGEGYFEVEPNHSSPFIIITSKAIITVIGTKFNVSAYPSDSTTQVAVLSGIVKFASNTHKEAEVQLSGGEEGLLKNNADLPVKTLVNNQNFLSWKTKGLFFDNTNITEVAKILSKVYDTQIEVDIIDSKNCNISGRFEAKTLDEILELFVNTLGITFEKKNNKIVIKGEGC